MDIIDAVHGRTPLPIDIHAAMDMVLSAGNLSAAANDWTSPAPESGNRAGKQLLRREN